MAFDPSKKNTNNFQSMPPYGNPYSPPSAPQKKGAGAGVKIAIAAIIFIFLITGGMSVYFYLNSNKGAIDNSTGGSGQVLDDDSVVEVEIFN